MMTHSVLTALQDNDLQGQSIVLLDYNGHARRLVLRIAATADARLRTIMFDGVIGLHCDPQNALDRLGDDEHCEILRFEAMERPNREPDVTLVFRRGATPRVAMFRATGARWVE